MKRAMCLGTCPAVDGDEACGVGTIPKQKSIEVSRRSTEQCDPRPTRSIALPQLFDVVGFDDELPKTGIAGHLDNALADLLQASQPTLFPLSPIATNWPLNLPATRPMCSSTANTVILAFPLRASRAVNCLHASGRSSIERAVNCPRMGYWYSMLLR